MGVEGKLSRVSTELRKISAREEKKWEIGGEDCFGCEMGFFQAEV